MNDKEFMARNGDDLEGLCIHILRPMFEDIMKSSKVCQHAYPNPFAEKDKIDLHRAFNKIKRIYKRAIGETVAMADINYYAECVFTDFCSCRYIQWIDVKVKAQILYYQIRPIIDVKYPKLDAIFHILWHNGVFADRTPGLPELYTYNNDSLINNLNNLDLLRICENKHHKIEVSFGNLSRCAILVSNPQTIDEIMKILNIVRPFMD